MSQLTRAQTQAMDRNQLRWFFLQMALRRARPGTGSSQEFLKRRTAMYEWPDLSDILDPLPWAVTGGVATRAYMPERATKDIDVLVPARFADQVTRQLTLHQFVRKQPLAIGGWVWLSPDGIEIDIIEGTDGWVEEALGQTERDPQGLPVLSLSYLILMKVSSSRTLDLGDAARMLGLASDLQLEQTRQVIRLW